MSQRLAHSTQSKPFMNIVEWVNEQIKNLFIAFPSAAPHKFQLYSCDLEGTAYTSFLNLCLHALLSCIMDCNIQQQCTSFISLKKKKKKQTLLNLPFFLFTFSHLEYSHILLSSSLSTAHLKANTYHLSASALRQYITSKLPKYQGQTSCWI